MRAVPGACDATPRFRCTSSSEIAAGVMPEMRAAWPIVSGLPAFELLLHFGRQAAHLAIVEIRRNAQRFLRQLARDLVAAAGRYSPRIWSAPRPVRPPAASSTAGPAPGQCHAATHSVTPGRRSKSASAYSRSSGLPQHASAHRPRARPAGSRRSLASARARSRSRRASARTRPSARRRRCPAVRPCSVRRRSALSSRSCSRYSARDVNIRYGSVTPWVMRSSTSTPR